MTFSETDDKQRKIRLDYIQNRWSQLQALTSERAAEAWKYLMLINSGSAIAVLSFMGANKTITPIPGALWMLGAFVLGVIFVGCGHGTAYYRVNWLFVNWRNGVEDYYADRLVWKDLLRCDSRRVAYFYPIDMLAWLSFLSFLTGLGIGAFNLSKM